MRWAALFVDLEAQLDAAERAELDAEVADRRRLEVSRIPWSDRLRAAAGAGVDLAVTGAGVLRGRVLRPGPDWLLIEVAEGGHETLVCLGAVTWLAGLPAASAPDESVVDARLGLGSALRRVARDRSAVTLTLRDATTVSGTIDRVGADALDLAVHPADLPRRPADVVQVRTVPFAALAVVRPA